MLLHSPQAAGETQGALQVLTQLDFVYITTIKVDYVFFKKLILLFDPWYVVFLLVPMNMTFLFLIVPYEPYILP